MMRRGRVSLWAAMLSAACLLGWLGQGCRAQAPATRIVCGTCEDPDRFVRVQAYSAPRSPDGQGRFSHPFTLSPQDWKYILASVQVQTRTVFFLFLSNKQPETPVFSPDEVEYLSRTLSKAFAEAQPEEWVVFGLSQPGPPGIVELTTGGWYVAGARLHLLLANYRAAVTMSNIREVLERDPLFEIVGSTLYEFVPGDFAQKEKEANPLLTSMGLGIPHLAINYQQLLTASVDGPNATAGTREVTGGGPRTTTAAPRPSLEERLQTLKRLKEQGLVTEEEFLAKKKQLLDQF